MQYLEKINLDACVGYLEHVIHGLNESGAEFHDKFAEIYLDRAKAAAKKAKDSMLDRL